MPNDEKDRLTDLDVAEVSLVGKPANKRSFLVFKEIEGGNKQMAVQALFPVIKFFGQILLIVARVVGSVWNALIELVSLIPFVNFRNSKMDLDALSDASKELANMTWEEAEARKNNTEALENQRGSW